MKEKLLELLKLPTDTSDEKLIAVIGTLVTENATLREENDELLAAPAESDLAKFEKRIQKKIAESSGALNREQAITAITHQDEAAAKAKAPKKK